MKGQTDIPRQGLWAVRPEVLPRIAAALRAAATAPIEPIDTEATAEEPPKLAALMPEGSDGAGVAVLPLRGVITPNGSSFIDFIFGGSSSRGLKGFMRTFREALASADVSAIVIDVDSPGGSTDLITECAGEIREARGTKPIVAVANTMAASAAYALAVQADELVVTPSGDVGSIGVFCVHEDWSGWNERTGIDPTYISAGKYKVETNPDEPLGDEARDHLQEMVNDFYDLFVADVAAARGVEESAVRSGYGEGRCLTAKRAVSEGLADRVATLSEVLGELTGREEASRQARLARNQLLTARPRRV